MAVFDLQRFAGEKTERATPKRRQEVRHEGRFPKSSELTSAVAFAAGIIALKLFGVNIWNGWLNYMHYEFQHANQSPLTQTQITSVFVEQVWFIVKMVLPIVGIMLIIGLMTAYSQVGTVFLPHLVLPDFRRIQLLSGWKRLWSVRSAVEALKSILKLSVIGTVAYITVRGIGPRVATLMFVDISALPAVVGSMVFRLAIVIVVIMLCIAFIDFRYQRYEFEKSIRMSKQEIIEERKNQEGDPKIRSRIRQRGREIAYRRMMQEVPKADVIVTNPTHYAVALKYDAETMAAPTVVAKGQDEIARRIRELASENGVPLVENKPLAQGLYKAVEVGHPVPSELYQAVAEVLAYVYRLRQPAVRG